MAVRTNPTLPGIAYIATAWGDIRIDANPGQYLPRLKTFSPRDSGSILSLALEGSQLRILTGFDLYLADVANASTLAVPFPLPLDSAKDLCTDMYSQGDRVHLTGYNKIRTIQTGTLPTQLQVKQS